MFNDLDKYNVIVRLMVCAYAFISIIIYLI